MRHAPEPGGRATAVELPRSAASCEAPEGQPANQPTHARTSAIEGGSWDTVPPPLPPQPVSRGEDISPREALAEAPAVRERPAQQARSAATGLAFDGALGAELEMRAAMARPSRRQMADGGSSGGSPTAPPTLSRSAVGEDRSPAGSTSWCHGESRSCRAQPADRGRDILSDSTGCDLTRLLLFCR